MNESAGSWNLLAAEEIARAQQAYLDRLARPGFYAATSAQDWLARAAQIREHALRCLGLWPLPERLPLNLHVGGIIEHDDYTLKRVYWQTWPNYYASGYLYMPKHGERPAPAVLCPHGHWENGARHPIVQARCISLATKGYVVLAVDSVHVYNWSAGLVPLTVMIWNDIRGIDLLCSLPEVDSERLGCTGASGGGQQTFYLMAVEDRLKVAIPVCMVSQWRRILFPDWHHCTCNHVPGILTGTDTPELAACFAPRPALIISVTGDWTAWLPQEGYPEIRRVYELFGAGDRVRNSHYDWNHDYSLPMREEAYAWFNKHLKGITDPEQALEPAHKAESLEALAALDAPPPGAAPASSVAQELLERFGFQAPALDPEPAAALGTVRSAFMTYARKAMVADSSQVHSVGERQLVDGLRVERVIVTSEQEIPVPCLVVYAQASVEKPRPAVILLDPAGKANVMGCRQGLVARLAAEGWLLCLPDPRPFGELALHREAQDVNGVVLGRPELVVSAHDVKRVAAYIRSRSDVSGERVSCLGWGDAAPVALAAGLFDPSISAIAAMDVGDTYSAQDRLPRAPRILSVADLPQLAAALAPRRLWIQGARQPEDWAYTTAAYQMLGANDALRMTGAEPDEAEVVTWLTTETAA